MQPLSLLLCAVSHALMSMAAGPLQDLLWDCTQHNWKARPTAAQCVARLQDMLCHGMSATVCTDSKTESAAAAVSLVKPTMYMTTLHARPSAAAGPMFMLWRVSHSVSAHAAAAGRLAVACHFI